MMRKIQESIGSWVFNFYLFNRWYSRVPYGIDDFFDGLRSIPILQELEPR